MPDFGDVDLLINNTGTAAEGDFEDIPFEEIHRMISVNYCATVRMLQAFLPSMIARERGHVVYMASVAGLTAMPTGACYSASKHAVVGMSEALRAGLKDKGIKVTVSIGKHRDDEYRLDDSEREGCHEQGKRLFSGDR